MNRADKLELQFFNEETKRWCRSKSNSLRNLTDKEIQEIVKHGIAGMQYRYVEIIKTLRVIYPKPKRKR